MRELKTGQLVRLSASGRKLQMFRWVKCGDIGIVMPGLYSWTYYVRWIKSDYPSMRPPDWSRNFRRKDLKLAK